MTGAASARPADRLFALTDDAVEIKVGSLDMAPSDLEPTYELWVKRREGWLRPLPGAEQFEEDRIQPVAGDRA